jgi:uncharacterized protein YodC (DUF2158 family)
MVVELVPFIANHRFEFGQMVRADGAEGSPPLMVTGVQYQIGREIWSCEWWYNGTLQTAWIESARLKPVEKTQSD